MAGPIEEPMSAKVFREAFWKLVGEPTPQDKIDTIVTDIIHIMEDAESLRQSIENLRDDLLEFWKSDEEDKAPS